MSELKEKILGPSNIRSQAIKVIILSVILITAFAFSVSILTFVFGSVRNKPSERKSDADFDDPVLVEIPIPFDIDDLMDLFEDLDLTPEELQELLETLMEMYDGDFDDIPLEDLAALMAAMMFSDVEAFRVYDYPSVTEIEDYLWKYECFDQYSQGSWSASDPSLDTISFHTYAEYASNPDLTDLLTVKMLNLSANAGINQFTIPTLFSSPFLIENSVSATALDNSSVTIHSQTDGLNGSALRASFTSSVDTNLTYQLAGDDLPDATEINDSCALVTSPSTEYNQMLSDYQQMDGQNIMDYMNQTHMADFKALFDYLNSYVISPGDNAFIIANKIRNYLQYNFVLNYSPMPGTEQDRINWFCASGEGLYSDFASVFCALTRAFGVPSRFVDGFNTRFVSESLDPFEGTMTIPILYRNIYSWAEIFVPTSNDGSGNWTQFDVYFENFGGIPPIPPYVNSTFKLVVECDGSSYPPDYALVNRDDFVNVTAILMNGSTPVPNEVITFSDYVTGMTLGTNTTNSQGAATIFVEANISFTVGPNLIMGKYSPQVIGGSFIVIDDIMTVNLNYVNPTEINVSDVSNSTFTVSGNVTDPNNGRGVPYSNVEFLLYFNNTSTLVSNPFTPGTITADVNGEFSGVLTASSSIYRGPYDLVANVSGSANYTIPSFPYPLQIPLLGYGYAPGNSSQRRDVFIDKVGGKIIYFYINDVPSTDPSLSPIVSRGSTLTLKARVLNETGGDLDGIPVTFYDYTRGDQPINTNATVNGWTTIEYDAGSSAIVGPNLLYARTGFQSNYSYFILNDTVDITLSSGPSPRVVNVSVLGQNRFTITGYLNDNNNSLPLNRSYLMLRMFRSSIDYTAYLTGNPIPINGDGSFNSMFYVNPSISPGNYTLRLDFNGSFDFWNNNPNNPHYFDLPYINGSLDVPNQLQITNFSPIQLDFWIDDFPNYDYLNPVINRYQNVNLSARLSQGGLPLNGLQVHFYDITNGTYIGSNVTDSNGYAWFVYDTGFNTVAGPHLIRALYGSSYDNYSFFVLDDEINVSFDSGPVPSWVYDNHPSQATFHIMGTLYDAKNGRSILGVLSRPFWWKGLIH
ncbi:MAG: transglutaminase domain-containing protein, partial [Promethearchaeota archaeon]